MEKQFSHWQSRSCLGIGMRLSVCWQWRMDWSVKFINILDDRSLCVMCPCSVEISMFSKHGMESNIFMQVQRKFSSHRLLSAQRTKAEARRQILCHQRVQIKRWQATKQVSLKTGHPQKREHRYNRHTIKSESDRFQEYVRSWDAAMQMWA